MNARRSTRGILAVLAFAMFAATAIADPVPIPVTPDPAAGLFVNFSFQPLPVDAAGFFIDVELTSPGTQDALGYAVFDGPNGSGIRVAYWFFYPYEVLPPGQHIIQTSFIPATPGLLDGSMSMSLFAFEEGYDYLASTAYAPFYCSSYTEQIPGELALPGGAGRPYASQTRPSACPEPPTLAMFLIGLGALGWSRRRGPA